MTTTLAIADDVASAAREIATREGKSLDDVVSDLARKALAPSYKGAIRRSRFPLLERRGVVVTTEMVNALRDEEW